MTEKVALKRQLSQMKEYLNARSPKGVYAVVTSMDDNLGFYVLEIRKKRNWLGFFLILGNVFPVVAGKKDNTFDVLLVKDGQEQNLINLLHEMVVHANSQIRDKYVQDNRMEWHINYIAEFNLSYLSPVDSGLIHTCN